MGRVTETVSTVNSALRTLLMLVLVAGAGIGGYKAYEFYNQPRQQLETAQADLETALDQLNDAKSQHKKEVVALNSRLSETTAKLEKVELNLRLLKVKHRLARLTVLDQREIAGAESAELKAETGEAQSLANIVTKLSFKEINEEGNTIGEAREFEVVGDMVYIDYLRVTFDDKYIEESDLDRSTAIALFQRIFGEHQNAVDGVQLDTVGTRPSVYGSGSGMSDFERKIWDDFWLISNDKERAAEMGIHAAHHTAVGQRVVPGMTYEIDLRATGDMTIRPIDEKRAAVNENPAPADPPN